MSFRATCSVCPKVFWHPDNRNAGRKHLTCSPECRKVQRAQRQRERRKKAAIERLEARHVAEQFNLWHRPRRKGKWKGSHSSQSKPNPKANGHGPHTISKARSSGRRKVSPASRKRSAR